MNEPVEPIAGGIEGLQDDEGRPSDPLVGQKTCLGGVFKYVLCSTPTWGNDPV